MAMENTEIGIKIVGGIANIAVAVDKKFDHKELASILNAFGHKTAEGEDYALPGKLVQKSLDHYSSIGDTQTADDIKTAFQGIDLTLI